MSKLVMVSNRLPTIVEKKGDEITFKRSAGGLATGLASFYKQYESVWVGWPGVISEDLTDDEKIQITDSLTQEQCYPVFLSNDEFEKYYYGFCNETILALVSLFSASHYLQ